MKQCGNNILIPPSSDRVMCDLSSTQYELRLYPTCPMSLVCIGCAKKFQTQQSLSAHEAQCGANKALTANIHSGHHHRWANQKNAREKAREREQRSPSPKSESESQHQALRLSPSSFPIDADDFRVEVGFFIYGVS